MTCIILKSKIAIDIEAFNVMFTKQYLLAFFSKNRFCFRKKYQEVRYFRLRLEFNTKRNKALKQIPIVFQFIHVLSKIF